MLKRTLTRLVALITIILLTACDSIDRYEAEEVDIDLGEFLDDNKEDFITKIATEGEEVRIELNDEMNQFIFTIVIDSIELTHENQTLYSFAFDSSFVYMEEVFITLAEEIKDETQRDYFAIRVIYVDVNGEEIFSQVYSTLAPEISEIDHELID